MSDLLLKEHLSELTSRYKDEGSEKVRNIARVRTLTTLHRLDADRKYSVLQLLYEAHLIDKGERIVDLDTADLRKADLRGAQLEKANLWGTKLQGADLSGAHLKEADLKDADLSGADLSEADLQGANLTDEQLAQVRSLQGATMPDGSIHP